MQTYNELKAQRDEIETRMRELEQQTLEDIEQKLRDFGINSQPKQKRKRRTREEIEAARV